MGDIINFPKTRLTAKPSQPLPPSPPVEDIPRCLSSAPMDYWSTPVRHNDAGVLEYEVRPGVWKTGRQWLADGD